MNILVVDDSIIVRLAIARALEGCEDINIVGSAANGRTVLKKIDELQVDLITLDIEMPEMDGLATIKEIRKSNQEVVIIMFSTLSAKGAQKTLEAMALGADDYLVKSGAGDDIESSIQSIHDELIPKIRQFAGGQRKKSSKEKEIPFEEFGNNQPGGGMAIRSNDIDVVCIGASTGGPEALRTIFSALKKKAGPPILIAQHMPPVFTEQFAGMLDKISGIRIKEGEDREEIQQGVCYIAPGDFHMTVTKGIGHNVIRLDKTEKVNHLRPAVDVLFKSVAKAYRNRSLCIVLTGMGEDGLVGAKELSSGGTPVFIQDKQSSVVWGMPGAIFREGFYKGIISLNKMAGLIGQVYV